MRSTVTVIHQCCVVSRAALIVLVLAVCAIAANCPAGIINFETTPDGATPVDNAPLTEPYTLDGDGSVRLFFDVNGNYRYDPGTDKLSLFEAAGADSYNGFVSSHGAGGSNDCPRAGYESQLGNFFLRQPSAIGDVPASFLILYDSPGRFSQFSGEIWDIDGAYGQYEQWQVDVLNMSGDVLASQTSPSWLDTSEESLDSLPWTFAFTALGTDAAIIRLKYIGTKQGVGLAFNNFSPTYVAPEPSTFALLALATVGLLACAWRRQRATQTWQKSA
jgi:hypothetical protein